MNLIDCTYMSIWNDGENVVSTPVVVDFDAMEIVEWGAPSVQGDGTEPGTDEWTEQKVVTADGMEFTAMNANAFDETAVAELDRYGNGIVVYRV